MRIYVDADGCPVVSIAIRLAKEYTIPITLVKNYSHILRDDYAEVVTVDNSMDSADYYIVNHARKGDIVITQDNGLAAMCLAKEAIPINQNGVVVDDKNLNAMLSSRHINRELRQRGIYLSKAKKRDNTLDKKFEEAFRVLLNSLADKDN